MRQSFICAARSMAPHVLTMGSFCYCESWNGGAYFQKRELCQKQFHLKEISISETTGNLKDATCWSSSVSSLVSLGRSVFSFIIKKRSREQVS